MRVRPYAVLMPRNARHVPRARRPASAFETWTDAFDCLARRSLRPNRTVRGVASIFKFYAWTSAALFVLFALLSKSAWWIVPLGAVGTGALVFAVLYVPAIAFAWLYLQAIRHLPPIRRMWAGSTDLFSDQRGPGLWPASGALASVLLSRDASVSIFPAALVGGAVVVARTADATIVKDIGDAVDPAWIGAVLLTTCAVLVGPMLLQSTRSGVVRLTRPSGAIHGWTVAVIFYVALGVVTGSLLVDPGPVSPPAGVTTGTLALAALALIAVLVTAGIAAAADVGLARVRSRGVPRRYVVDLAAAHDLGASPTSSREAAPSGSARVIHDDALDPQSYERWFITHANFPAKNGVRPLRRSLGAGGPADYCWGHECDGALALAADLTRDALDDYHVPTAARDAVLQLVVARKRRDSIFECRTLELETALAFAGGARRLSDGAETRLPPGGGGW